MRYRRLTAWILSFAPLIITLAVLPMLPDKIPAHYAFNGNVDRYGSKYEMLTLPIITILMGFFWVLILKVVLKDKEKGAQNAKVLFWSDLIVTVTYTVLTAWFLHAAYTQAANIYSGDFDFMKSLSICVSVGWILLGNFLPKCKQNRVTGIRTKWTLNSEVTWYKTHRFGGKVFLMGGILSTILCLFFFDGVITLLISLGGSLMLVIPIVVYSYRIYTLETQ